MYVVGVIVLFIYIMRLVDRRRPRDKSLTVISSDAGGKGGKGGKRSGHITRGDTRGAPVDIGEDEMHMGSGKFVLPPVMWATSIIWSPYKPEFYYWEVIMMMKRISMVAAGTLMNDGDNVDSQVRGDGCGEVGRVCVCVD